MDNNLTYEMFIRRSWNVDRFKKGANTDTWDSLMMASFNFNEAIGAPGEDKSRQAFEKHFTGVKTHLDAAYGKLLETVENLVPGHADLTLLRQQRAGAAIAENPLQLMGIIRQSFGIINEHKINFN